MHSVAVRFGCQVLWSSSTKPSPAEDSIIPSGNVLFKLAEMEGIWIVEGAASGAPLCNTGLLFDLLMVDSISVSNLLACSLFLDRSRSFSIME